LIGTDNYDSIRGTNPIGCVFSEYAMQDPRCWTNVVSPILRKNGGWAIFNSTPMGRNHFYDLWTMACQNPSVWYTKKLTVADTGLITEAQIEQERLEGRSEETIQQEFFCFPPDAPILTKNGEIPISQIKQGDLVITHRERYMPVEIVESRFYKGSMVHVKTTGLNKELICTPEHRIRSGFSQKWIAAGALRKTDYPLIMHDLRLSATAITSITKSDYEGEVYNIRVAEDRSYVAYGIVVHNCDFNRGVEGSYYGRMISKIRNDNRVCKVPYDSNLPVHTFWDLGFGDSTSILFVQLFRSEIRIIDFYENHNEGLAHYAKVLQDRGYRYGDHWAPHDVESGSLSTGMTLKRQARDIGINFRVVPKTSIDYGIELARGLESRLYFDEKKCEKLIGFLESYRKRYNDRLQVYSDTPLHDYTSHAADAFRYMAVALNTNVEKNRLTPEKILELRRDSLCAM
jgi:hypothetical protein